MNAEELLPAYLAGELSEAEREQVRAALAASPELRAELTRYQQLFLFFVMTQAEELHAPADLSTRIMRQVTLQFYLNLLTDLTYDLFGAYGRAIAFYLGLR